LIIHWSILEFTAASSSNEVSVRVFSRLICCSKKVLNSGGKYSLPENECGKKTDEAKKNI
jgi:hypothetical protein